MTTIRANCPTCGDVQLSATELTVRVCADDNRGSYLFRCPSCAMAVTKGAEQRIIDLLVSSGVVVEMWTLPLELLEHPTGELFTHDDVLGFHELLEQDDWFATVVAMVQG